MNSYKYFVSYCLYQSGSFYFGNCSIWRAEPITDFGSLEAITEELKKELKTTSKVIILNWQLFPTAPSQVADKYLGLLVRLYEYARLLSENAALKKRTLTGEERVREQGRADAARIIYSIFGEAPYAGVLQQIVALSAFAQQEK